jgi:hypothetical protein
MSLRVDSTTSNIKLPPVDICDEQDTPPVERKRVNCICQYYDSLFEVVTEMPEEMKERLLDTKMCTISMSNSAPPEKYFETLKNDKWFLYDTVGIFIQTELREHGKKPWMHQACKWTQLYA